MLRQPNRADVVRALIAAGFAFTPGRGRGGHDKWQLGRRTVMVPRHRSDVRPGTFASIRRLVGGKVLVVRRRDARAGAGLAGNP